MALRLLTFYILLLLAATHGASAQTFQINQPFIDTIKCPGDSLYLSYSASGFNTGNTFTAQISNANGSFTSPVTIGSVNATGAGTIACKLPQSTPAGSGHRVRIISSSPVLTGTDNGKDILVKVGPTSVPIATDNNPCANDTLKLTSTSAGSGLSYSWSGPNGFSANTQNANIPIPTMLANGSYIITALASSTGCSAKDTVSIKVRDVPTMPLTYNNGPLCPGDTLYLNAWIAFMEDLFSWSGPLSFNSNTPFPTIFNITAAHAGVYSVTATSIEGCVSPVATTTVVVKPMPATPTVSSNSPVCGGADIDLIASSTPGSTFSWRGPNGYSDTGATRTITAATAANAGTYEVTASLDGCKSATTIATTNVVVNVVSSARAFVSPNDTICPGGTAAFVVMPQNAGSSPKFQWFKNGNIIPGETNPVLTTDGLQNNDSIYCRMTATNVCISPLTIFTNKIKMTVLPGITVAPVVTITSIPAQPIPGQPATFNAVATAGGGMSPTYQWQRNGVDVPGAVYATFSANNLAPYEQVRCILISDDACASPKQDISKAIVANFPTGIVAIDNDGFNLYPNPNKGSFILKGDFHQRELAVEVVNAVGQTIYSKIMEPMHGELNIDLGSLAPGVYLLRIRSSDQSFTKRFTIQ